MKNREGDSDEDLNIQMKKRRGDSNEDMIIEMNNRKGDSDGDVVNCTFQKWTFDSLRLHIFLNVHQIVEFVLNLEINTQLILLMILRSKNSNFRLVSVNGLS